MSIKNKLAGIAATAVATFAVVGLSAPAIASAATPGPLTCNFQTVNSRNFVTAVGSGGRTTDAIHSDATSLQAWEKFTVVRWGGDGYAIQTINGHYLTAVGGGGRTTDTIHTDATNVNSWELFFRNCS